ncbi:MAG: WYL domain-containing protein [Lachnospiraceae bacterium]|nr:WYL domain-containing protein [Lachnospiraceae bacterium]
MPKNENQKLKLYYLYRIMLEQTDEEHGLSMQDILTELAERGITCERKSIYRDFKVLTENMGLEIIGEQVGSNYYYHVGQKQFELAELKLLVDSVQASKFITEKKSDSLIKKITTLASVYEAEELGRQVHVQGRIKTMNESIYYNVDEIHNAINQNSSIKFKYMQWSTDKKLVPRKTEDDSDIKIYEVSPWALTWDDENYYLIAFDHNEKKIKHYRVDKMDKISITGEKREGRNEFRDFDPGVYAKKNFGMFSGETKRVEIEFPENMVGVFIDRFGKDIMIKKAERKGYYKTFVEVAVSKQFFGWIFALGPEVKINGPEEVVKSIKKEIKDTLKNY